MFTLCVSSFILDLNSGFGFYKLKSYYLFCHFIDYWTVLQILQLLGELCLCIVAVSLVFLSVWLQVLSTGHLTTQKVVCFATLT